MLNRNVRVREQETPSDVPAIEGEGWTSSLFKFFVRASGFARKSVDRLWLVFKNATGGNFCILQLGQLGRQPRYKQAELFFRYK